MLSTQTKIKYAIEALQSAIDNLTDAEAHGRDGDSFDQRTSLVIARYQMERAMERVTSLLVDATDGSEMAEGIAALEQMLS